MLRDQLVSDCAGIILDAVRSERGRLTFVSVESRTNRTCFTRKLFRNIRWFKFIRILYCLSMKMEREAFKKLGEKLFDEIWLRADYYDYVLLDERKKFVNGRLQK